MTWRRAGLIIAFAAVFDALRFAFTWLAVLAPVLGGLMCTLKLSNGTTIVNTFAAIGCSAAAGVVGAAAAAPIQAFGLIMADVVGFIGLLFLGFLVIVTNMRIIKAAATAPLQFAAAFMIGEIPFLGSLPVFTFVLVRLYRAQIKAETASLEKWEAENAARLAEQRKAQELQLAMAEQNAANDALYQVAAAEMEDQIESKEKSSSPYQDSAPEQKSSVFEEASSQEIPGESRRAA
jgi:hypothetical protein